MKTICIMPLEILTRYNEFLEVLAERLPERKAAHAISVATFLVSFTPGLGIDNEQAGTAGLLHDMCRALKGEEMIGRARRYGIPINAIERNKPNLLHGPVAAEECRRILGIEDQDIYDAIYWHTTGRPGLCRLGQALYVADFAEPSRKYPEALRTRVLLETEGFDKALYYVAETKIGFLLKKKIVAPISAEFFRWVQQGAAP